jgi:hypothetical protein
VRKTSQTATAPDQRSKAARAMPRTAEVIAEQVRRQAMSAADVREYAAAVAELFGRIADEAEDAGR